MTNYRSLCTEYYDLVAGRASDGEIEYYKGLLCQCPGPYLEAMCGSGRLLIPLVEQGLMVDGVDYSADMLNSCRKRLGKRDGIELVEASVESMELSRKYGTIFIAAGSLQLLERNQVVGALKNLKKALKPEGVLILEMWVPWHSLQSDEIHKHPLQTVETPDGKKIEVSFEPTMHRDAQFIIDKQSYQKFDGDTLIDKDLEELKLNWYYRYEMELLLEKAGFSNPQVEVPKNPLVPDSLVYKVKVR